MQMAAATKAAIVEEMTRGMCQYFRKIMDILLSFHPDIITVVSAIYQYCYDSKLTNV